jgi:uncharacterized membrane protein YphA (DoxX/SURF4 family)
VTRVPCASLLAIRPSIAALALRVGAGVIFVAFSIGKFTRYEAESNAFDRYGIPFLEVTTYPVGVLELAGGPCSSPVFSPGRWPSHSPGTCWARS